MLNQRNETDMDEQKLTSAELTDVLKVLSLLEKYPEELTGSVYTNEYLKYYKIELDKLEEKVYIELHIEIEHNAKFRAN